jgi:hypothetical protein
MAHTPNFSETKKKEKLSLKNACLTNTDPKQKLNINSDTEKIIMDPQHLSKTP